MFSRRETSVSLFAIQSLLNVDSHFSCRLRGDRYLLSSRIANLDRLHFCLGRNGGHLTAHNFMGFGRDTTTWGISDAVRAVHIEEHVIDVITSLVKDSGLGDEVDLIEGTRTALFFTKEEEAAARDEYEVAKAAGIDVSVVEWLTEGEVEKVRRLFRYYIILPPMIIDSPDIWSTISRDPHPRKHDMATQTRHSTI